MPTTKRTQTWPLIITDTVTQNHQHPSRHQHHFTPFTKFAIFKYLLIVMVALTFYCGGSFASGTLHAELSDSEGAQAKCLASNNTDVEINALVELFKSTNGFYWKKYTHWLWTNRSICSWSGVVCDSECRVSELKLTLNDLAGTIPASLGNLSSLSVLDLSKNSLIGNIPSQLGSLANLVHLNFAVNKLVGPIPQELGNLNRLVLLNLILNRLSGPIPPSIGNILSLKDLYLSENQLSGSIPPELGMLNDLTLLSLRSNMLTGTIPPELGQMSSLTSLYLYDNQLMGTIPPELANLNMLESLDLSGNQLNGTIPASICNLNQLSTIKLMSNLLSGTILSEFGSMQSLKELHLSVNQLHGTIPPALANPNQITLLAFKSNFLTGTIPPELGNMRNLQELDFEFNQLSGTIPSSLRRLVKLKQLSISNNNLYGDIPVEFGSLLNLSVLELFANFLNGTIPPSLFEISSLTRVELNSNSLIGTIPSVLKLSNLLTLDLSMNKLTGTIPPELGSLPKLVFLSLHSNLLGGSIPPQLSNLSDLDSLYLNNNQLYGAIPDVFGKTLLKLRRLSLHSNHLTGTLPSTFSLIASLQYLHVSENRLHGTFPISLSKQSFALQELYISSNEFEDPDDSTSVFDELNCSSLLIFEARANRFQKFPLFQSCSQLKRLDISRNFFTQLPSEWRQKSIYAGPSIYLPSLFSLNISGSFKTSSSSMASMFDLLSTFRSLSILDMSSNFASPQSFSNQYLVLPDQQNFTAPMFATISQLFFNNNNIIGSLPAYPLFMPALSVFSASNNRQLFGFMSDDWKSLSFVNFVNTSIKLTSPPPSFITVSFVSSTSVQNSNCAQPAGINGQSILMDDSFQDYRNCRCDAGYSGQYLNCTPCLPGTFGSLSNDQDLRINAICDKCPLGSFQPSPGSSACIPASDGQFVDAGRSTSHPCVRNAKCERGVMFADPGFWVNANVAPGGIQSIPCTKNRCIKPIDPIPFFTSGLPSSYAVCSSNRPGHIYHSSNISHFINSFYSNLVCGSCFDGFIEVSGSCIHCDSYHIGYISLIWVANVIIVGFLRIVSQDTSRGTVKIFSFYIFTMRQIIPSSWISYLVGMIDFRVQGSASSGDSICVVPADSIAIEGWTMLLLLITWLNVLFLYVIEVLFWQYRRGSISESRWPWSDYATTYIRTFLAVLAMSVSSATDSATSILLTFQDPNFPSIRRLREFPTISTSDPVYSSYYALAIIIWILLGIYLMFMLFSLRFFVSSRISSNSESKLQTSYPNFHAALQVWYDCYRSPFLYAEVAMVVRRIGFFLLSRLLQGDLAQTPVLNSIIVLSLTVIVGLMPYQHNDDNVLEILLLFNVSIFLGFASSEEYVRQAASAVCVIFGFVAFAVCLMRQFDVIEKLKAWWSTKPIDPNPKSTDDLASECERSEAAYVELPDQ